MIWLFPRSKKHPDQFFIRFPDRIFFNLEIFSFLIFRFVFLFWFGVDVFYLGLVLMNIKKRKRDLVVVKKRGLIWGWVSGLLIMMVEECSISGLGFWVDDDDG
ncbi:hypothetical protein Dsin_000957 [Dipteronia sinensis]|uniref:Transmembrane protein n=1 Tax=Dipteronia sinensis TaxID=43782 RepID=A0AAE0B2Y6_9ROSI|nr:hypothetical protein Dsin_000957 [Dipteronia sinensis]